MDTNTVIRKLQALLARGNKANNDNEHERAIAMRQAQKLMDQYNISITEIEGGAPHEGTRGRTNEAVNSLWKATAFNTLAPMFGVLVYRSGKGRNASVVLVGSEHNRVALSLMGHYVIDSIESEAKKHAGKGRPFIHAFKLGAVSGVGSQVTEIVEERRKGTATTSATGNSMVLVDYYKTENALNARFIKEELNLKLRSGNRSRATSSGGYGAGQSYGAGISLNGQIGGRRRLTA